MLISTLGHAPPRRPLLPLLSLLLAGLVALPAAAAQVVTTSESESITDPTLDPTTTTGEPTGTIVIVAPTDGQHFEGEPPVPVMILTEATGGPIGRIEILVDGVVAQTCEATPTCDAAVELEPGDHGIDAALFGAADEQLAMAPPVTIHVHAAGTGTDTTTGTTGDSGTGTGGDDDKGGCACRSGEGGASGLLGLLLAGLPLARRRRR